MNPVVLLVIYRMVDIQLLAILVRTVHTVQQTVDFHRYSSLYGCHALVVVQRQVPWLERAETVEFRSCSARRCNDSGSRNLGSTMDTCSASSRSASGRICTIFYLKG